MYCERKHSGNEEHLSPSASVDCCDMCQRSLLTARIWGQIGTYTIFAFFFPCSFVLFFWFFFPNIIDKTTACWSIFFPLSLF